MIAPWLVGLDLGKVTDPTALAIAERRVEQWGTSAEIHYTIRRLVRFPLGTPYGGLCRHGVVFEAPCAGCRGGVSLGGIVEQVQAHVAHLPTPQGWYEQFTVVPGSRLALQRVPKHYELILDHTGVGQAVADMFLARGEYPIMVTCTTGRAEVEVARHVWHVAKPQLLSPLQVVLQTRRLHMAPMTVQGVRMDQVLVKEAMNFQYRLQPDTGTDTYGTWREKQHDDVLFAGALVVWWGEKSPPPRSMGARQPTHARADWHPWQLLTEGTQTHG